MCSRLPSSLALSLRSSFASGSREGRGWFTSGSRAGRGKVAGGSRVGGGLVAGGSRVGRGWAERKNKNKYIQQ